MGSMLSHALRASFFFGRFKRPEDNTSWGCVWVLTPAAPGPGSSHQPSRAGAHPASTAGQAPKAQKGGPAGWGLSIAPAVPPPGLSSPQAARRSASCVQDSHVGLQRLRCELQRAAVLLDRRHDNRPVRLHGLH